MGGWLAAVDVASGRQLWVLKVYGNGREPTLEGNIQDVFFRTMVRQACATLLIENERRGRFAGDPASRTIAPAPWARPYSRHKRLRIRESPGLEFAR